MSELILLDFHASWCEPCKWAEPVMKEALTLLNENVQVKKIDVDNAPQISKEYDVLSVPTFILLAGAQEIWRLNGFDTASKMASAMRSAINTLG
jgi:thioredoxin 1